MARYTGPKTKIARKFGEPIFGADKVLSRKNYPPGQHGVNKRRKSSEYGVQLREKQKAKYTCPKCGGIVSMHDRECSECQEKMK